MNRRAWVRRAALGAGALLAVLVVGAAVFVATFDVNRYRAQIVAAVQERTGRTLAFDGDLALTLWPRLAVRLPATTVSEPRRDAVFARLRSARASLELLPLLRGELVVGAVRIEGLQATIVRQKDGRTNVDDLFEAGGAPGGKAGAPPAASSPPRVAAVELEDADLTLRDLAAGRTVRLGAFDLQAGRYAPGARTPVEARADVNVSEPAVAASVELKAGIEWDEQGAWRAIDGLALDAKGTVGKQPMAVEARAGRLVVSADALEVRDLRVGINGKDTGGAPLTARLAAPRLAAGRERAGGERIDLAVTRGGDAPLDVKATIDGVSGTAARLEAASVKAQGSARSGARTTRFDLAGALAASVDARTLRFDRIAGDITVADPALGATPVRVPVTASAAIDGARETVAVQFDARGEGLAARGKVNATGFAAPRIAFEVDADEFDADRYLLAAPAQGGTASQGGAAPKGGAPAGASSADPPVDFGALRGLDLAGNLRVARLRVRGTDVADLRVALKAANGRLDLAPLALRVHGGTVDGRVGLDARGNRVAAAGTVDGIQVRPLIGRIGGRAAVEGRASGRFDLAAAGATVGAMKRALAGNVAVDVRDGALVGIDLADLIGTAAGFLQSRGRQSGALDENRRTPFSQLAASVRIANGVATNDDLRARSPQLDVTGSGRMDLVSTELDYVLRAQVLAGPATERGALRSLAGLTVPVKITGPMEKPSYTIDWAPIAAEALLRRATGRTGAPAVNPLLEGLGDLLRRKR